MTKPRTKTQVPVAQDKSRVLQLKVPPGISDDRAMTDLVAHGVVTNASTALRFTRPERGDLSLTEMVASLQETGEAVNRGDLSTAERMLSSQAVALNEIFGEMARRAALCMNEHLTATETYLRLALKAQGQCRSTLETLAAIKNPPTVFARQANFAHGPQQVNNHAGRADLRKPEIQVKPNELFEEIAHGCPTLDDRATKAAGREDQSLVPVDKFDGPTDS